MNKISDEILNKYPRTKRFLEAHPGMDLDTALAYTENLEKKLKKDIR